MRVGKGTDNEADSTKKWFHHTYTHTHTCTNLFLELGVGIDAIDLPRLGKQGSKGQRKPKTQ